jgi:hypothetical protein
VQRSRCTQVTSDLPCGKACFRRSESVTSVPHWKLNFRIQLVNSDDTTALKRTVCSSISSMASGGRTSIIDHLQAKKHRNALPAKSQSGCGPNCFCKLEQSWRSWLFMMVRMPTILYSTITVFVGWIVQVYRRNLQTKKCSCVRIKCKSVVTNVVARWVLEELKNDLKYKYMNFVTVSCGTSNLKHVKQMLFSGV